MKYIAVTAEKTARLTNIGAEKARLCGYLTPYNGPMAKDGLQDRSSRFDSVNSLLQPYDLPNLSNAFARLNNYISREQALTVCNAVILSNFNYCPLIWLFCNKGANKEIDRTHKRALRILYEDYESSFETLLARSGSNNMHIKNLQKLMTEIYKSMNHLNPSIVWNFMKRNP